MRLFLLPCVPVVVGFVGEPNIGILGRITGVRLLIETKEEFFNTICRAGTRVVGFVILGVVLEEWARPWIGCFSNAHACHSKHNHHAQQPWETPVKGKQTRNQFVIPLILLLRSGVGGS